jgi:hypothetical protein
MKTTLNIDDDVLEIMRKLLASLSGLSLGKVISGYVRTQLPRKRIKSSTHKRSKT